LNKIPKLFQSIIKIELTNIKISKIKRMKIKYISLYQIYPTLIIIQPIILILKN